MIKNKYVIMGIIISLILLLDLILLNYPIEINKAISLIGSFSLGFWIMLVATSALITYTAFKTRSTTIAVLISGVYFLIFYSYNLFFIISQDQSDIGATSMFLYHIKGIIFLDPSDYTYFTCPIYFISAKVIMETLGLGIYSTINVGFFIYLISIPLVLPLTMVERSRLSPVNFLIYPAIYLIMSYFFLNSQFIPQFIALVFLILTIGAYVQMRESGYVSYYYLIIIFFVLCVWSHPFMFAFFLMGLAIDNTIRFLKGNRFLILTGLVKREDSILDSTKNLFKSSEKLKNIILGKLQVYIGKGRKTWISATMLLIIYFVGYSNGFYRFGLLDNIINPQENRGESWFLISYLLGSDKKSGLVNFDTYPLYNLVPYEVHFIVRSINLIILSILVLFIAWCLLKVSKKILNMFDIYLFTFSSSFLLAGFVMPGILGQRAVQVMFLNIPQYIGDFYKKRRAIVIIIILLIVPVLSFPINFQINESIGAFYFVEDSATLGSGRFVEKFSPGNETIFTPDRSFYPVPSLSFQDPDRIRRDTPISIVSDLNYTSDPDMVFYNDKILALLNYYDLSESIILNFNNTIYDQGRGKVIR